MKRCDGVNRREFLRVGSLAAFGLGLADVFRLRADANPPRRMPNCILVWLDGGPSHLDMFDLKPDAPAEVRGPFRPIDTNVNGVRICEEFPRLARQMDKVCVVRSMTSDLGEHNFGRHYMLTGYRPSPVLEYPSIGSVVSHVRGGRPTLPSYIAVPDASRQASNGYLPGSTRFFAIGGDPSRPDFRVRDLETPAELAGSRLQRRRSFLNAFDQMSQQVEDNAVRQESDAQFDQAFRLISSTEARTAFDLTRERPQMRQRYGRHRLGQSCLLARRLVEAGCPFVTVTDRGWDNHQQIRRELREGFVGGHAGKLPKLDQALTALLTDLQDRRLLDETLVLVMGEFGRTPKLNTRGGRDHWPRAYSVLLAGGGVRGGQVVGSSDSRGESAAENPVSPTDLACTVYTALGIAPGREFRTADNRPVAVNAGGNVIRGVLEGG